MYRSQPPPRARRKIAYNIVFGTAALAFVIGALVLTVPELITGGSLAGNDRRTTLGGGNKNSAERVRRQSGDPHRSSSRRPRSSRDASSRPRPDRTETVPTAPGEETAPPGEPLPQTDTTTTPGPGPR